MKTEFLELEKERALTAYRNGTEDQKKFLIDMYGREEFLTDVKDRVTDYPSACIELGISPLTIHHFTFLPEEDQERAFARHQISTVVKALRGEWKPDFKNSDWKYYVYYYWNTSKNGFSSGVDCRSSSCGVGSDLLLPSEELAQYTQSIMHNQYLTYLTT